MSKVFLFLLSLTLLLSAQTFTNWKSTPGKITAMTFEQATLSSDMNQTYQIDVTAPMAIPVKVGSKIEATGLIVRGIMKPVLITSEEGFNYVKYASAEDRTKAKTLNLSIEEYQGWREMKGYQRRGAFFLSSGIVLFGAGIPMILTGFDVILKDQSWKNKTVKTLAVGGGSVATVGGIALFGISINQLSKYGIIKETIAKKQLGFTPYVVPAASGIAMGVAGTF